MKKLSNILRLSLFVNVLVFAPGFLSLGTVAWAQEKGGLPALANRVDALETTVAKLTAQISALQAALTTLQANNTLSLGPYLTVSHANIDGLKGPHIILTGANVHIRDGSGHTDDHSGPVTGLGNLIVGYNETHADLGLGVGVPDVRTGSHNVVVGAGHNFSKFGGLVAGELNTISGEYASVCGGFNNIASGSTASVSGGADNVASAQFSSVSGGAVNIASGVFASVSGGRGVNAPTVGAWAAGGTFLPNPPGGVGTFHNP